MELLLVVAERKIPAEAFFPSFSNCWNTPAMRWQLVKAWKALRETVLSTTRTSHPYQRATKRWQCHRESDLMGVLALKLTNTKLHLGRRGRSPWAQQPLPAHICPYPRELGRWPLPPFHSAWGFCVASFEPPSFHGVSVSGWLSTSFLASSWAISSELHWPQDISESGLVNAGEGTSS